MFNCEFLENILYVEQQVEECVLLSCLNGYRTLFGWIYHYDKNYTTNLWLNNLDDFYVVYRLSIVGFENLYSRLSLFLPSKRRQCDMDAKTR